MIAPELYEVREDGPDLSSRAIDWNFIPAKEEEVMLWIDRPSGKEITDEKVALTVRDENRLIAAEVDIRIAGETVQVLIRRIENDPRVEVVMV